MLKAVPTPPPVSDILYDLEGFLNPGAPAVGPFSPEFEAAYQQQVEGLNTPSSQPVNMWVLLLVGLGAFMILKGK